MIHRPAELSVFEFVILSGLRATQLMRGCIARMDGVHKNTIMAQMEVAAGKVVRAANAPVIPVE